MHKRLFSIRRERGIFITVTAISVFCLSSCQGSVSSVVKTMDEYSDAAHIPRENSVDAYINGVAIGYIRRGAGIPLMEWHRTDGMVRYADLIAVAEGITITSESDLLHILTYLRSAPHVRFIAARVLCRELKLDPAIAYGITSDTTTERYTESYSNIFQAVKKLLLEAGGDAK